MRRAVLMLLPILIPVVTRNLICGGDRRAIGAHDTGSRRLAGVRHLSRGRLAVVRRRPSVCAAGDQGAQQRASKGYKDDARSYLRETLNVVPKHHSSIPMERVVAQPRACVHVHPGGSRSFLCREHRSALSAVDRGNG